MKRAQGQVSKLSEGDGRSLLRSDVSKEGKFTYVEFITAYVRCDKVECTCHLMLCQRPEKEGVSMIRASSLGRAAFSK